MLLSLNISNFAVFENVSVDFDSGFNVFTGETGSGKSVLINAIELILGDRASKELIRKGKNSALIEGIFDIGDNDSLYEDLKSLNIEIDKDDFLIISRELLQNGKSINKVNGRTYPLNTIKAIGSLLIDIYGQFGHESLFKKENHIKMLDSLIQNELSPLLQSYNELFVKYNRVINEISTLKEKLLNKDKKIEQLQYEINEIDSAELKEFEEEELLKNIKKLSNIQEIKKSLYDAIQILNSDNINNVYSIINKIKNYDEKLEEFLSRVDIQLEELKLLSYDLRDYSENLDLDEKKLDNIENRMSLINRLKRKYGFSIEKINEYRNASHEELSLLLKADSKLNSLITEKNEIYNLLIEKAGIISKKRKTAAEYLEKQILIELSELNMKNIEFEVKINKKNISADGVDDVEFLISTNVGSDLNSVQKIVSGGEASRIMLAFKKIKSDIGQTMVFDEIDMGISGKTAQMAGVKMNYIAKNNQVICVTHSPQIASISKNHFLIEKKVVDNNTFSTVKKLDKENKIYEIARLLSGMKITEKSINNAKELIEFNSKISE
ncbi:MAG TPA: DNA repair protein RecN [Sedimentibacter sp.]|jgi:DNA repair protein RecN (Recombination protein N)|nr:DNA repair protein RecN [Clostridiales bacterium]HOA19318.1 DNA repair protein RecN [Sedimentibacter sp.]HOG62611.1 DNA repair protein RecN [Sedimentibacter sp.]HOT22296.1 DNA repair protein RecN [Sedimentibacter sp.]HQC69497.1 DNA repair protein RecN [Sedimentibacter sp.]